MRWLETVSAWMTEGPVALSPGRPVIDAHALMSEHGVRHLPVVEDGRLVGLISDRDLQRLAPLRDMRKQSSLDVIFETPVSRIMTRPPLLTVGPAAPLAEAARLLIEGNVHALPVVEGERLVGIITSHDLVRALVRAPAAAPAR